MKLVYKKIKYRKFNKHKVEKLKRKYKRKKLKKKKYKLEYKLELEEYRRCVAVNEVITFPERLNLAHEDEAIFALINTVEEKNNAVLDFSETNFIDIGSALYIKAFIDHLKDEEKQYKILCSPKNKKMRQILKHIGVRNYKIKVVYPDIKCWEIRTWGKHDNVNYGKVMMEEILPKVLEGKVASEKFSYIASSLQEILSNCSEHAYTEDDEYKNYYLIAGEYEDPKYIKSNSFTFCILDRGQGFRSSLEKKSFFGTMREKLGIETDSDLLQAAIEGRLTSKAGGKSAGRGTGLANVVENVKSINGSFYAYSDKGCYEINRQKGQICRERKIRIKGAIVAMIFPINEYNTITSFSKTESRDIT